MKYEPVKLEEFSVTNDTAFAICYDLVLRERHRVEPLVLSRYARGIKKKMVAWGFNTFDLNDFFKTIDALEAAGWGSAIRSPKTKLPQEFKFSKDIKGFDVATKEGIPQLKKISHTLARSEQKKTRVSTFREQIVGKPEVKRVESLPVRLPIGESVLFHVIDVTSDAIKLEIRASELVKLKTLFGRSA